MLSQTDLWKLRQEIRLGSLFVADYRNSFGVDPHKVCDFFDGFLEFVWEGTREDYPRFDDGGFFDLLPDYDTREYLLDWYYCFEEDPLAKDEEDENDEHD